MYCAVFLNYNDPATTFPSMPHSFLPRNILKKPFSAQSLFHELAINQYGVPLSTPHPTIFTACPPLIRED